MTVVETLYEGYGWRLLLEEAPVPGGRTKKAARAHRVDSVIIMAFNEDNHVLLLREYRPFLGTYVWMLPSGRVDKETDLLIAAQRELREETGFEAKNLTPYFSFIQSESVATTNHVFIGKTLVHAPLPQDADECIEVHPVTLEEAIQKVLSSKPIIGTTATSLMRYEREHR